MISLKSGARKRLMNIGARYVAFATKTPKQNIFKNHSLIDLVKQAVVYKASQNDFVLAYGDKLAHQSYKFLGKGITNCVIENTGGQIFTSGPTIKTLTKDSERFYTDHGVWGVGNYVLEGIERDEVTIFDDAKDYLIESLDKFAKGRSYCHLAIKLTGLGHMQMFKNYHNAQFMLLKGLFTKYAMNQGDEWNVLTRDGVKSFLKDNKIEFTDQDIDEFFTIAKNSNSKFGKDEIGEIEFYENVHAHYVFSDNHKSAIIKRVCEKAGLDTTTREAIYRMQNRMVEITEKACSQNTLLFVDAEQTYIQLALDGFTRQLQSHYHKGRKAFILNGHQSNLKSSPRSIKLEVARCKSLDIGLGIKLIRGAYMNEERKLAKQKGYESPIWDTIEDTHKCYDGNLAHIINNLNSEKDFLIVASHNRESCEKAKKMVIEKGLTADSLCFGQLKGFSDSLTFSLAEEGFNVAKYLPYGPTHYLIPYLIRRGQESKQVMREHLFLNEITAEIKRRMSFRS